MTNAGVCVGPQEGWDFNIPEKISRTRGFPGYIVFPVQTSPRRAYAGKATTHKKAVTCFIMRWSKHAIISGADIRTAPFKRNDASKPQLLKNF